MINNNVISILNHKGKTINWLRSQIGMTHSGLSRALENGTIEYRKLNEIASVLDVPISEILGFENVEKFKLEIIMLKDLLAEKSKIIKDKEEIIELLRGKK